MIIKYSSQDLLEMILLMIRNKHSCCVEYHIIKSFGYAGNDSTLIYPTYSTHQDSCCNNILT